MELPGDALWPDLKDDEVVPLQGSATSLSLPLDWVRDGELAFAPDDAIGCAPHLGSNEASSPEPCLRPSKRHRDMDLPSVIDRALSDLEDECLRLRAHNRQLQAALSAAISQAQSAAEENRRLNKYIQMLAPHKSSFELVPQLSATASSLGRALSEELMAPVDGNGLDWDLPQPQQHSAQRQGGNDAEGAEKAQAEAVAAAALAVNKGNPAAAMIDLLCLSARTKDAAHVRYVPQPQ